MLSEMKVSGAFRAEGFQCHQAGAQSVSCALRAAGEPVPLDIREDG